MARETSLQKRIRIRLQGEFGGFWYKVWGGPFQPAGLPDLHGDVPFDDGPARSVWVEVKDPRDGVISPRQVARMRQLMDMSAAVCVATSPDEAAEFVRMTLGGLRFCFHCMSPRSAVTEVGGRDTLVALSCATCGGEI